MYCRSCSNELDNEAVACPVCGMEPYAGKKFCPGCRAETNAGQVMCTRCGISLAGRPVNSKVQDWQKNPSLIAAAIAIIACCFPWLKLNINMGIIDLGAVSPTFSMFNLSAPLMMASSILVGGLLYLLPLSLIGIIASDFLAQLAPYKKYFVYAAVILVVYAGIGLYQVANPSGGPQGGNGHFSMNNFLNNMRTYKIGWGYYACLLATFTAAFFSLSPKKNAK